MNAAQMLVRGLEAHGVRYVFGIPGEENEDLMFALADSKVRFVACRHEQGAAFIANLWGRITGQPGVCLATLGPGATNLITGLADAQLDQAPVVAITGQGGLARINHQSHQIIDVVRMMAPICKWNASIHDPAITAELVAKAFCIARADKPGVTHLELPEDVAAAAVPGADEAFAAALPTPPNVAPEALEALASALKQARQPLVLAGNAVNCRQGSAALTALASATNLPVVATFMGKGALSDRAPQSLLALGLPFRDYVNQAVDAADTVLCVGYDVAELPPKRWNAGGDKRVLHLDTVPAEPYADYRPQVEAVGEITVALGALTSALAGKRWTDWYAPVRRRILEDLERYAPVAGRPLTIPGVLSVLREVLPDDGLLISDVGSHKLWIARNFPTCCPGGCIISNGLASMALALPGGIAGALAQPDRAVVGLMGDGGFLMNVQELETAHRLGCGFTVLVVCDDDFGLIRWNQERHRGSSFGTALANPDFVKLAESFGVAGYAPADAAELRRTLQHTISSRELAVVAVRVDPAVNLELVHKLKDV